MINKKGFTLVEVIVSLVLVSVVLTFMLASLVKLRETYTNVTDNTIVSISSSSISRVINNDIDKNGGIKYVFCKEQGNRCDIILNNEQRRVLEIYPIELMEKKSCNSSEIYCDVTPKVKSNGECYCPRRIVANTLKYSNVIKNEENTEEKIIYIKTLKLTENYDAEKNKFYTNGYIFYKLDFNSYTFRSVNKFLDDNKDMPFWNVISSINIGINDKLNFSDDTHGISIYSASSFPPGAEPGKIFTINFNHNYGSLDKLKELTTTYDKIFLKYGVGFSKDKNGGLITKIEIPIATKKPSGNYTFKGYYKDDLQIIDKDGNILVPSNFFSTEVTLEAKWE